MLALLLLLIAFVTSLRAVDIRRDLFDYKAGHRSLPDLPHGKECARWTVKLETCVRETPQRSPDFDFWADEARCMLLEQMGDDCVSIIETFEFGPNDHDHIVCKPPLKAYWATAVIWRSPKQYNLDLENTTLTSPYLDDIHSIRTRAFDFKGEEQALRCRGTIPAAECARVATCQWETINGTTLVSTAVKKPPLDAKALSRGFGGSR